MCRYKYRASDPSRRPSLHSLTLDRASAASIFLFHLPSFDQAFIPIMMFAAAFIALALSTLQVVSAAPAPQPRAACKNYSKHSHRSGYGFMCSYEQSSFPLVERARHRARPEASVRWSVRRSREWPMASSMTPCTLLARTSSRRPVLPM
jgi:hypothetical protein